MKPPLINPDPLITRYLAHVRVEKRLAPRTVDLYALHLDDLQQRARDAGLTDVLHIGPAQARRWVMQLHAGGHAPRGIALIVSVWRGFFRWLLREGALSANPFQDVHAPKAPRPIPKALGVDDAVQLADFVPPVVADPWLEARDRAMVELLYSSGLRVSELTGLDVHAGAGARGWLDLDAAQVHVLGKGNKRREVPVGQAAMAALHAWLSQRAAAGRTPVGASAALFVGRNGTRLTPQAVWQRVRQRAQQAGLPTSVHPHVLRHSFASHVLQSSGDLRAVQDLLGHANISTTQVYTRLDFQHLARAYDAAHPRARRKPGAT